MLLLLGRATRRGELVDDVELPDIDALTDWVGDRLPGAGRFALQRMGQEAGIANALYLIGRDGHEWVLRRPPAVKNDPSAGEHGPRVADPPMLSKGRRSPTRTARLLCEDPDVIGATFMIMDRVDGFTPGSSCRRRSPPTTSLRHDLAMAYVDGIVALAAVDWVAGGLEGLGKPDGFLERQVARWPAQLDRYRTRELPELDFLCGWLEANRPDDGPGRDPARRLQPVQRDGRARSPARLAAIVDWDTGTIGDPLLDIGHLLARWTEPGEEPVDRRDNRVASTVYPPRAAMAARYAERTGRDLCGAPLLRGALIVQARR